MPEYTHTHTEAAAKRDSAPSTSPPQAAPGASGIHAEMFALQRAAGNQAVSEFLAKGDPSPETASALREQGQPLTPATREEMEARFGQDFGDVRLHEDKRASESARQMGAQAYTVGNEIVVGKSPTALDMGRSNPLLAHELTHVVQQRHTGAVSMPDQQSAAQEGAEEEATLAAQAVTFGGYAPAINVASAGVQRQPAPPTPITSSDDIPIAERKKIQVISTTSIPTADLEIGKLFAPKSGLTLKPPSEATVVFAGVSDAALQNGLTSVAGKLTAHMSPPPVKLNSTITLFLDLSPYSGKKGLYRFTYYEHAVGKDTKKQILIEFLGEGDVAALDATQKTASEKQFKDHGFTFDSAWKEDEKASVYQALPLVGDALLTHIDKATFARGGTYSVDAKAAGNYSVMKHTITIFDLAFTESATRFGVPGKVYNKTINSIVHEIGHAIDTRKVQTGLVASEKAKTDFKAKFGQYETTKDNYSGFPLSQQGEFNRMLAAAQAPVTGESESGHKWQAGAGGKDELVQDPAARTKFRDAAAKDGTARLTPYSEQAWEEFFAESFALYRTDPATLKRLRPNIFTFFESTLARAKTPTKKP